MKKRRAFNARRFKAMLREFVQRNFTEEERRECPDIHVAIGEGYDRRIKYPCFISRHKLVIPSKGRKGGAK